MQEKIHSISLFFFFLFIFLFFFFPFLFLFPSPLLFFSPPLSLSDRPLFPSLSLCRTASRPSPAPPPPVLCPPPLAPHPHLPPTDAADAAPRPPPWSPPTHQARHATTGATTRRCSTHRVLRGFCRLLVASHLEEPPFGTASSKATREAAR